MTGKLCIPHEAHNKKIRGLWFFKQAKWHANAGTVDKLDVFPWHSHFTSPVSCLCLYHHVASPVSSCHHVTSPVSCLCLYHHVASPVSSYHHVTSPVSCLCLYHHVASPVSSRHIACIMSVPVSSRCIACIMSRRFYHVTRLYYVSPASCHIACITLKLMLMRCIMSHRSASCHIACIMLKLTSHRLCHVKNSHRLCHVFPWHSHVTSPVSC